jgi:ABC-type polysaccharide/polyol phosphate export permease
VDQPWIRDPGKQHLILFNPLAVFCEGFRRAILRNELLDPVHMGVAAAFSVVCFVGGLWYFRRREWQLPEVV